MKFLDTNGFTSILIEGLQHTTVQVIALEIIENVLFNNGIM